MSMVDAVMSIVDGAMQGRGVRARAVNFAGWSMISPLRKCHRIGRQNAVVFAALFGATLVLCGCAASAADSSESIARSLLQHCLELQTKTDRISTRGVVEGKFVRGAGEPSFGQHPFWLRRDGNLLDISGPHEGRNGKFGEQFRVVCNNDYQVVFSKPLKSIKRSLSGIVWHKELDEQRLRTIRNGAVYSLPLDGYLHGAGGKRAAELLLEAKDVRVVAEELIDGVRCAAVAGSTEYGKIALWIPQGEGSIALPRKTTITKESNDLMSAGRRVSEVDDAAATREARMTGFSEVLDQVAVARTGHGWVCVGGRLTQSFHLTVGGDNVGTYLIKRNETELQPAFEGTDAFVTDLPDGASVNYMDDPNSGVEYVWHGGKVEVAAVQFQGDTNGAWPRRFSTLRITIAIASVLGLFALAAWLYLRHK
jgi:hypothetical protein